jgi:hypothetical protein
MTQPAQPLTVIVAGPYRAGTDDLDQIAADTRTLNGIALRLLEAGHLPLIGECLAAPISEAAGSRQMGDRVFRDVFRRVAGRLIERCDACLRIGGPSPWADEMVGLAKEHGKRVFHSVKDIPGCA